MLNAGNGAFRQPRLNVQIAHACLKAGDPVVNPRTWQTVMDELQTHGEPGTQMRCARAMLGHAFDPIRKKPLLESGSDDLLAILKVAKVSKAHYLRQLHNLAVDLGRLPWPLLAPKLWQKTRGDLTRQSLVFPPPHPPLR